MPTAYSRVTVVNGTRRVDLALPSSLPLADVLPQLLGYCDPAERPTRPQAWSLGRVGGPTLSSTQSLSDAGVLDGDVLELRSRDVATQPAYVEDVRDAVEDAVDESGGLWRSRTTVKFALIIGAIGLLAATFYPDTRRPEDAASLAAAALVAALTMLGTWWAVPRGHRLPAGLLIATGMVWGGIGGWLVGVWSAWDQPGRWASALVGALAVAIAARIITSLATVHLATAVVLAAAAIGFAITAAQGWEVISAARVEIVLAVLLVGSLPRVSLSVGGLASADYRVRNSSMITTDNLSERVRRSSWLLAGGLFGSSVVGGLTAIWLAYSDSDWDRWLSVLAGLALLLRSRMYSRVMHVVPLRLAGVMVLGAHGVRLVGDYPGLRPWFVLLVGLVGTAVVALSALPLSEISHARTRRLLNWTEIGVVAVLVVLAAGALGVFQWMIEYEDLS